jgi:hypothetical protein
MPSKSKKQQRFFGAVRACQKTGNCLSPKIKKVADSMSNKSVEDFAKTKHKNLPEKVSENFLPTFSEWINNKHYFL